MKLFLNNGKLPLRDGKLILCTECPCAWGEYTGKSFQVAPGYSNIWYTMFFSSNGNRFFAAAWRRVTEFNMSALWDITTADAGDYGGSGSYEVHGIAFSPNGKYMIIADGYYDRVKMYELSTAWDVTTRGGNTTIQLDYVPGDVFVSGDGMQLYVVYSLSQIYHYKLSSPWNLLNAELEYHVGVGRKTDALFFSPDGSKLYILSERIVHQFYLPTAWDIRTAVYETHSVELVDKMIDIYIDPSGTRLFLLAERSAAGHILYEYSIPAWPGIDHSTPEAAAESRSALLFSANAAPSPSTSCRYAEDTGERAFPAAPCRGNRIICHKIEGHVSYTKACAPEKCNYYEEG